jgi:hypothetical protein
MIMPKVSYAAGLIPLLCLIAWQPVKADVVIDNTNGLTVQASGGIAISPLGGPGGWVGTTFRTGSETVNISRLTANLGTSITQNTYDLALYSIGAGSLPDQLLASASINLPPFQNPGVYTAYEGVNLGSIADVSLTPSTPYALVVRSFGSDLTSSFGGWNQFPGFYPNCCNLTYSAFNGFSQLSTIGNYSGTWYNLYPSGDVLYQLEVAPPIPVPAPLPILGATMALSHSRTIEKRLVSRHQKKK